MNPEPQNFDQLCKLLALKRHEVPPPRYFNDFSGSVIARLHQPLPEELSWWQRLGLDFDLRPALMCGVGVLVCGMLSFGLIGAMQIADAENSGDSLASSPMGTPVMAAAAPADFNAASISPLLARQSSSPFNQFAGATPVGFRSAGPFDN